MLTFKQFLAEIMVDLNKDDSPADAQNKIRHKQNTLKVSPQRVVRDELQAAQKEMSAASASTAATKAVDTNIARKKEELARLEQTKLASMKNKPTTPGTGPVTGGM